MPRTARILAVNDALTHQRKGYADGTPEERLATTDAVEEEYYEDQIWNCQSPGSEIMYRTDHVLATGPTQLYIPETRIAFPPLKPNASYIGTW